MYPTGTVERICAATKEVFSTMLDLRIQAGEPYVETTAPPCSEVVISLIGLAGSWAGTGSLSCSAAFACRIASRMLMIDAQAADGDVLDAVAEVTNMIIGNVKTGLEPELGPMGMSIPTIIVGRNFIARSAGNEVGHTVPFTCEGERMEVKFCLSPKRTGRAASVTSYALQGVAGHQHASGSESDRKA